MGDVNIQLPPPLPVAIFFFEASSAGIGNRKSNRSTGQLSQVNNLQRKIIKEDERLIHLTSKLASLACGRRLPTQPWLCWQKKMSRGGDSWTEEADRADDYLVVCNTLMLGSFN